MFSGKWRKFNEQWPLRPSGCVRGRRTLAVLTFGCRSDQSAWPCGRSSSLKQPSLHPWYLPNRRHYINLTADTGYASTRHCVELPGCSSSTFSLLTSNLLIILITKELFLALQAHTISILNAVSVELVPWALILMESFIWTSQLLLDQQNHHTEEMLFFPTGFVETLWLTKRTQTSFVRNHWQMNFQNTLNHVFFQGINILGKG